MPLTVRPLELRVELMVAVHRVTGAALLRLSAAFSSNILNILYTFISILRTIGLQLAFYCYSLEFVVPCMRLCS